MKGVILNEFRDFADAAFPADGGEAVTRSESWDANGRYDASVLAGLVRRVSEESGVDVPTVLRRFGKHTFGRFTALDPAVFLEGTSCLEFLTGLNTTIHGEVQKLYPDAEFPRFEVARTDGGGLELGYRSPSGLADFAEGLLLGCIEYFGEPI